MLLPSTEAYHSSQPSNRHSSGLLNSSNSASSCSSSSSKQGLMMLSLSTLLQLVGLIDLLAASQTQLQAIASQEALLQLISLTDLPQQLSLPQPLRLL